MIASTFFGSGTMHEKWGTPQMTQPPNREKVWNSRTFNNKNYEVHRR